MQPVGSSDGLGRSPRNEHDPRVRCVHSLDRMKSTINDDKWINRSLYMCWCWYCMGVGGTRAVVVRYRSRKRRALLVLFNTGTIYCCLVFRFRCITIVLLVLLQTVTLVVTDDSFFFCVAWRCAKHQTSTVNGKWGLLSISVWKYYYYY